MRASRLVSLLLLLQNRGRMTAQELADELEVSVRTIYRDVDALNAAGIPLYGDAGHAGGYQLLGGYRTRLTGLTAAEAQTLFLSGLPGPAAELGLGTVLAAATLKVRAALPPSFRENADRLSERFYLDAPGWYGEADAVPYLPIMASAVWEHQVIQVQYRRWKEPSQVSRRLEPHGLVLKAGVWYVVARCDGTFRTYRVDQITDASAGDGGFHPEPGFDLEAYWRSYLADFHRRLHAGDAVIRLSPDGVRRMHSLLATAAVTAVRADGITEPDGWIRARVPIESARQALADFLRLGADLEIIEPAELREQAIGAIGAMAAVYHPARLPTPTPPGRLPSLTSQPSDNQPPEVAQPADLRTRRARVPVGAGHDPRGDERHAVEVGGDLLIGPPGTAAQRLLQHRFERDRIRVIQGPEMRDEQATAGRHRLAQPTDDRVRVLVVVQVVQDRARDDGNGAAEVQQRADLALDQQAGIRDVPAHHDRLVVLLEQRPSVDQHDRILVHVGDAGRRIEPPGNLMHVIGCRQPRAKVKELRDAQLVGDIADRADQAGPVVHRDLDRTGVIPDEDIAQLPVSGKVVLPPDQVVIGAGYAGHFRVERCRFHRSLQIICQSGHASIRGNPTPPCHHVPAKRSRVTSCRDRDIVTAGQPQRPELLG
jgi:predicted DNA-binding transcriptional regulator YafY